MIAPRPRAYLLSLSLSFSLVLVPLALSLSLSPAPRSFSYGLLYPREITRLKIVGHARHPRRPARVPIYYRAAGREKKTPEIVKRRGLAVAYTNFGWWPVAETVARALRRTGTIFPEAEPGSD